MYWLLEDSLHVHPVAGQGFNLVLRDIEELYKKIKKNISLLLRKLSNL